MEEELEVAEGRRLGERVKFLDGKRFERVKGRAVERDEKI